MRLIRGVEPITPHLKTVNILLVEDIPIMQRSVKALLESMGCIVSIASNFSEGIQKINTSLDGILTDVGLPDGNGFDVVKHIHKNFPRLKAIIYMYSAFGVDYIKERISGLPIKGYFGKPFGLEDIEKFVKAVVENKRIVALEKSHW